MAFELASAKPVTSAESGSGGFDLLSAKPVVEGLRPAKTGRALQLAKFEQGQRDRALYGNAAENASNTPLGKVAGTVGRNVAGVGAGFEGIRLAIGQRLGLVDQAAVNEFHDESAMLLGTPAGFMGQMISQMIALAPVATVAGPAAGAVAKIAGRVAGPTAGTIAGGATQGAAIGAAAGATTPTLEGESAAVNTAVGAGAGAVLGGAGATLPAVIKRAQQSKAIEAGQNQVRNATARMANKLGFKLSPVEANPASPVNQVLEGTSGKFLTRQTAQLKNAVVSDDIAKGSLPGFQADRALTHENLGGYRNMIIDTHYQPLKSVGDIPTGGPGGALDQAVAQVGAKVRVLGTKFSSFKAAAKGINKAIRGDVRGKTNISADDTISLISEYRAAAKVLFRKASGENGSRVDFHVANAKLEMADALEGFLEQHVQRVAKTFQLLGDESKAAQWATKVAKFREGRTLVARSLTLDRSISGDGHVNALKLARMQAKGQPLGGGLENIASIATSFPHVMGPVARTGAVPQVSILDAFIGAAGALKAGHIEGALAAFARPSVRATILSNLYQNRFAVAAAPRAPGAIARAAPAGVAAIGAPQGVSLFKPQAEGVQ